MEITKKREQEKEVVSLMIKIYCSKKHHTKGYLCDECRQLDEYARERSDKCPFMETKTFCSFIGNSDILNRKKKTYVRRTYVR